MNTNTKNWIKSDKGGRFSHSFQGKQYMAIIQKHFSNENTYQ